MKQEMSSVDVAAILRELQLRLQNARIGKIYQISLNEIRIGLYIFKQGKTNLVIEAGKRLHLTKYPKEAPRIPQAFPMLLRKHLSGGRITSISQYDFDRIIEIHVQRGENKLILLAELFSKGNILLLNSEKRIILPLKSLSFKDRKIRGGEVYELPQPQINPITVTYEQLKDMFLSSDTDVVKTIATRMNIGGQYAEEICSHAGIEKNMPASQLGDVTPVLDSLRKIFKPLSNGLKPHIVLKDGKGIDVLPFELQQYNNYEKRFFETFNEALDEYFNKDVSEVKQKEKQQDTYQYRLQKQMQALNIFKKERERFIHKGEVIYAHYNSCDRILNAVKEMRDKGYSWEDILEVLKASDKVKNIYPEKGIVVVGIENENIELDIKLSVPQNAQVYYDKAKKLSSKIKGAMKAIERTKQLSKKEQPVIIKLNRTKQRWYEQFRWFVSSDGFLVIGGRDAQSNENIVKKYLEKRDIFFHTHVLGSPAVIIKTEGKEIPETTLMEAAQFTVSYSSIWKSGQASGECYWVFPNQVSKTPESGEYIVTGAFVIRGKRNYFKDVILSIAIGIEFNEGLRLIGGPPNAIKKRCKFVIEIEPGEFNQNDLAKKIYRMLYERFEDKKLIKTIASPDNIAKFLPPGGSRIKGRG